MTGRRVLRNLILLTICLSGAVLITGCWDATPIDEMAIILAMGIDLGDEPDTFAVTFEVVKASSSGGGGGKEPGKGVPQQSFLVTGQGRTVMEAMQSAQRQVSRRLFLSQIQNVIFGEELARSGLAPAVDFLQRSGELRRTMSVVVSKDTAKVILESTPELSPIRGLSIDALTFQGYKTGEFDVIFGDFLERIAAPGASATAPVLQKTSEGAELMLGGMAVFVGDRVVGFLDQTESLGLSLALGRAQSQTILVGQGSTSSGKFFVSFSLHRLSSKITPRIVEGKIEATISIDIRSFLFEQTGGGNLTTPKGYAELQKLQEETVRAAVEATIKRAQELGSDVFELGSIIERKFPQQWRTLVKEWPTAFSEVKFHVEVTSHVTETGLIKGTVPIHKGERL